MRNATSYLAHEQEEPTAVGSVKQHRNLVADSQAGISKNYCMPHLGERVDSSGRQEPQHKALHADLEAPSRALLGSPAPPALPSLVGSESRRDSYRQRANSSLFTTEPKNTGGTRTTGQEALFRVASWPLPSGRRISNESQSHHSSRLGQAPPWLPPTLVALASCCQHICFAWVDRRTAARQRSPLLTILPFHHPLLSLLPGGRGFMLHVCLLVFVSVLLAACTCSWTESGDVCDRIPAAQ